MRYLKNGLKKRDSIHHSDGDARIYDRMDSYAQSSMNYVMYNICQISIDSLPPMRLPSRGLFQLFLSTHQNKISSAIVFIKKSGRTKKRSPSIDIQRNQAATGTKLPMHSVPSV